MKYLILFSLFLVSVSHAQLGQINSDINIGHSSDSFSESTSGPETLREALQSFGFKVKGPRDKFPPYGHSIADSQNIDSINALEEMFEKEGLSTLEVPNVNISASELNRVLEPYLNSEISKTCSTFKTLQAEINPLSYEIFYVRCHGKEAKEYLVKKDRNSREVTIAPQVMDDFSQENLINILSIFTNSRPGSIAKNTVFTPYRFEMDIRFTPDFTYYKLGEDLTCHPGNFIDAKRSQCFKNREEFQVAFAREMILQNYFEFKNPQDLRVKSKNQDGIQFTATHSNPHGEEVGMYDFSINYRRNRFYESTKIFPTPRSEDI